MKKLVYFVVFLILVIALTPWLTGLYFKQQFLNLVIALNQDNRVKVSVLEYHVGWLTSHIRVNVIPTSPDTGPVEINLDETITHGPIIFDMKQNKFMFAMASIESNMHLPMRVETLLLGKKPSQGILNIYCIADFNGNWKSYFQMPALNMQFSSSGNIAWQGLTGDSNMRTDNGHISTVQSNFNIGAISATTPIGLQLNTKPISITYDGTFHPIGLWVGNFNVSVPNLSWVNSTGKNINIENLKITTKNDITSTNLYNGIETLSITKLELPGNDISSVSPANITLEENNFSAKGIVGLGNYLRKVKPSDISNNNDLRNQILALASKITTSTSTLTGDASFNTSLGAFALNGKIYGFTSTPAASLNDILKNSHMQIDLKVAVPLANKLLESYFQTLTSRINTRSSSIPSMPMPPELTTTQPIDQAGIELFNEKIAGLMKQGKLSLTTSMQIMTLRGQNLTPDQFSAGLSNLKLPGDMVMQITTIYEQSLQTKQNTTATPITTSADKTKDIISQWLKKGYLIQNQNDYVVSITRDDGVIKINGNTIAN